MEHQYNKLMVNDIINTFRSLMLNLHYEFPYFLLENLFNYKFIYVFLTFNNFDHLFQILLIYQQKIHLQQVHFLYKLLNQ